MAEKLKYNLAHQIGQLPREVKIKDLLKILEGHGINKPTFYRDQKIKQDSDFSIPVDRLMVYSKVFECTIEDLMNTSVKVKSLREELLKKTRSKKIKTGLS